MRRCSLAVALTFVLSLVVATSGAQAVVVNDGGTVAGVALVPGSGLPGSVSPQPPSGSCTDPWLSPEFGPLPGTALCWHGGPVMHANETFALAWDPNRRYWQTTRNYVEQYMRDVADGSGAFTHPYGVATQYKDPSGRAGNSSAFGGGCIDFGGVGGSACQFGSTNGTGAGHDYVSDCSPSMGVNQWNLDLSGIQDPVPNDVCLTDAQIKSYIATMVTQTSIPGHTEPGASPLVVLLTPPGVVTCLDSGGTLCSANSGSTGRFCSYHSHVDVGGTNVAYVVQPWTASWTTNNGCDDPDLQPISPTPSVTEIATDAGERLVSPLSQGHLAGIVNPFLNGWYRDSNAAEINDNGCIPLGDPGHPLDQVTLGTSHQNPYFIQREFNNAGVIESDPNALSCIDWTTLSPTFVVPSAVNQGDEVEFDGSTSPSSLIVPRADYHWDFGDGTTAVGPSVVHTFTRAGTFTVVLTTTDRGGNVRSLSQSVEVLGQSGQHVGASPGNGGSTPGLQVRLQLMPQSLRSVLHSGVSLRVSANQRADGIASIAITRGAARRAHIRAGQGPSVVIGRGTVAGLRNGAVSLRLHLSRAVIAKLRHLRHVTLTIRLVVVAAGGNRLAIDAAGHY